MEFVLEILPTNMLLAIFISLLLNVLISIAGLIPSAFLTAANIIFFGFKLGLAISLAGEAIGAILSFYLYRRGVEAFNSRFRHKGNNRLVQKLNETSGAQAFFLVIAMRIFPFMPSGVVTLAASMSGMRPKHFAVASTIGKIPALFIEAYSIHTMMNWEAEFQIVAAFIGLGIGGIFYIRKKR